MKIAVVTFAIWLGMLVLGPLAFGQAAASASGATVPAATAASFQQRYNDTFIGHPELLSGTEYVDYTRRYHQRKGFPFFLLADPQQGSVYYNDHYFGNQHLTYDVVLDQLVLEYPGTPFRLRLVNEKVRAFALNNHQFVRLVADSTAGTIIRTGFYEVLTEGPVRVLARRAKRLQEQLGQAHIDVEFIPTDKLFLKKNGQYYALNKKTALLRLLADRNKEVQKYVQAHKLKFQKKRFEASAVELARYYNGLPPQ